jgi:hypothetical protein
MATIRKGNKAVLLVVEIVQGIFCKIDQVHPLKKTNALN